MLGGFGFPRKYQGKSNEEFPFFKVGDMNLPGNERCMTVTVNTISADTLKKLKAKVFPKGTIIFPARALSGHQVEILRNCQDDSALVDLMAITGRSDRTKFRHQVLSPLLEAGLIEMTVSDKPRPSRNNVNYRRKYATSKGKSAVSVFSISRMRLLRRGTS